MENAIDVQNLAKRFSKPRGYWQALRHPRQRSESEALSGITFSVQQGEIVGLLGPNGAGKTTLIKILCTLLLPTEGSAYVNGYDVVHHQAEVRRSTGYVVADERSFHWRLTGRQNLRFFATLNNLVGGEGRRRVDEVGELVGLESELDRPFLHYSTGTRQKMAIARGLLTDPPILLLDEPTRSLDLPTARTIRDFVRTELAGRGRTVLIATHNMDEATELCGRVAVIDRGHLRAWGTPPELAVALDRTSRRLLLDVEGWTEQMTKRIRLLPRVQDVRPEPAVAGEPEANTVRIEMMVGAGSSVVADVIDAVVLSGGRITWFQEETPSLADLFLQITADPACRDKAGSRTLEVPLPA